MLDFPTFPDEPMFPDLEAAFLRDKFLLEFFIAINYKKSKKEIKKSLIFFNLRGVELSNKIKTLDNYLERYLHRDLRVQDAWLPWSKFDLPLDHAP